MRYSIIFICITLLLQSCQQKENDMTPPQTEKIAHSFTIHNQTMMNTNGCTIKIGKWLRNLRYYSILLMKITILSSFLPTASHKKNKFLKS